VIPAVAGVKYVSQVFADSGDQSTVEEEDGEELKTWACDLDWEQPDPFAGDSRASVFGSDDGYCSTQCEVVLFKAKTPSQGRRAIQQFAGDDLHENRFSNIMMACTFASTYYCAALFADVRQARATPLPPSLCVCATTGALTRRRARRFAGAGHRLRVVLLGRCLQQVKASKDAD
jgi:hypothetical protein